MPYSAIHILPTYRSTSEALIVKIVLLFLVILVVEKTYYKVCNAIYIRYPMKIEETCRFFLYSDIFIMIHDIVSSFYFLHFFHFHKLSHFLVLEIQ